MALPPSSLLIFAMGSMSRSFLLEGAISVVYFYIPQFCNLLSEVFLLMLQRGIRDRKMKCIRYDAHDEVLSGSDCEFHREISDRDVSSLLIQIKNCSKQKDLLTGKSIHVDAAKTGLHNSNVYVGGALVNMYIKCGAYAMAQELFDELPVRNIISWTALISGYTQEECHASKAFSCFKRMQCEAMTPDKVTIACTLKACGIMRAADKGQEVHAGVVEDATNWQSSNVGNALIDMYAKCGMLENAQEVFDELLVCNVVSWTALIVGYSQYGHDEKAFNCFQRMQLEGLFPDAVTFACIIRVCSITRAIQKGKITHVEILTRNLLETDIILGNALIDMYGKCGLIPKAEEVFAELPIRDIIAWSTLIHGYVQHLQSEEALRCFATMQCEGLLPDRVTVASILKACGNLKELRKGQEIHAWVVRETLGTKDVSIGNALIDMYIKCGMLEKSQEVFERLLLQDVVSWNTLMVGYVEHQKGVEALRCFDQMRIEGNSPNVVTFLCVLKACSSIENGHKGQEIHAEIIKEGSLEKDTVLGTALIDMYRSCGLMDEAQDVFYKLPVQDLVSWTALIAVYAQSGKESNLIHLLNEMVNDGKRPDLVTSTLMLSACSHCGLLDRAQSYFETMREEYGMTPSLEHYSCMIDLFARAGHLENAMSLIKEMPFSANIEIWHTVMAACQKWGNVELGRLAFEHALKLDRNDAGPYVYMYNIYSAAGLQEEANEIETMRLHLGSKILRGLL